MTISVSVAGRNAAIAGLTAHIDAGASNSSIVFYDGTVPTDITTALSGNNVIATSEMAATAFAAPANASSAANAIPTVQVTTAGTISFFRILDGDGTAVIQGSAGDVGTEDCVIDESTVVQGGDFNVTSLSLSQPIS